MTRNGVTHLHAIAMATAVTSICGAAILAAPQCPKLEPVDNAVYDQIVGQVDGRCCQPGRRWGCDPANFQQTGCIDIDVGKRNFPRCTPMPLLTMNCTAAQCEMASVENVCDMRIRTVAKNQCQPTGDVTTRGCNVDQWQCEVRLLDYTRDDAPTDLILVCNEATSTICSFDYSACD